MKKTTPLRLGIDAKWYFEGPPSGRIVVINLVDQIIRINDPKQIELYLFIDKKKQNEAGQVFGDKVKLIPIQAKPNLLSNVFVIPFYAGKHKLDAVLFQNFGCTWPKKLRKIVYIHDVLFLDYPQFYGKKELLYFKPMSYLARKADRIITISMAEKQRMIKHNIAKPGNISVIYHGISENFKPISDYPASEVKIVREKYKLPAKYILYVGRINIRKNIINLIKAMPLITDPAIKLVIVGKEDHKNIDVSAYINLNDLQDRIIFTGHVDQEDLYLIYGMSTVFCFPSFAEGFGLPPLEAMQCGIPSVVSNRTSLPEVCGDAALYIDPDDPKDIAAKIDSLLTDSALYKHKQDESLEHCKKYSWDKAAVQTLEVTLL